MPDCPHCASGLEETAEHTYYFERDCPFWDHVGEWTARIEPKQLVLLDVSYVVDNVLPPFQGEKRVVLLAILAVARMMIWQTRKKGLHDNANFSHFDLVLYFRQQLRVKIRCNRKRLDRITFDKLGECGELCRKKGDNFGVILLSSACPWRLQYGSFGTPSRVSRLCHRPRHLEVSLHDLPHPINFVPQPLLQSAFVEDLGISHVYNSYHLSLTAHTAPNSVFFAPLVSDSSPT